MAIRDDFKELQSYIRTAEEQIGFLVELVDSTITDVYECNIGMKNIINKLSVEQIDEMDEPQALKYLNSGFVGEDGEENNNVENLRKLHSENEEYKDKEFVEYCKFVFKDIKNSLDGLAEQIAEKDKFTKDVNEMQDNYFNYINSAEYKEKKREKINNLREQANNPELSITERRKILKMLDGIEASETLDFLFERLDNVDGEVENITDIFFDKKRSSLVMNRFASVLPRFGYNAEIYKKFFNIEETFLDEKYNCFNNIFLFHVMRHIAYSDSNDKNDTLFVSSILLKIYNLMYHRFDNDEMEKAFVSVIERCVKYFEPFREDFEKYNVTSPKHPQRIERDKAHEEKLRLMCIASLQNEGIEPDTTLETSELKKMLEDVMRKKAEEVDEPNITVKAVTGDEGTVEVGSNENNLVHQTFSNPVDSDDINVEALIHTRAPEELEEIINAINASDEVKEFDDFQNEVAEELSEYRENENDTDSVDETRIEEKESVGDVEIPVYVDMYKCMYVEDNGSYTYVDENLQVIEENINESTILQLLSTGSIEKKFIKK